MEFARKAIVTAVIGSMPLVIAGIINLAIKQSALASTLIEFEKRFLMVVQNIDARLDRIERKIDEKN